MFLTKLKFAVIASSLIATGAVVLAQQSTRTIEATARPTKSDVIESRSAVPGETTSDEVIVARELRRLDLDLLADEVEQLRAQVELALREKIRAERRDAGTAREGQISQPKDVKEAEHAYESGRADYLARSRELRKLHRQLGETAESQPVSLKNSKVALTAGQYRAEDQRTGKPEPHPVGAAIGSIDLAAVMDHYEKARQSAKQYTASINGEKERLNKITEQVKDLIEQKAKTAPSGSDFAFLETQILGLKHQYESQREVLEREFAQRQARTTATLLKEIQQTIASIARAKGLNYVVRVSPGLKPDVEYNELITAVNRSVLYADPRNDLTEEVIRELNQKFGAAPAKKSTSQ